MDDVARAAIAHRARERRQRRAAAAARRMHLKRMRDRLARGRRRRVLERDGACIRCGATDELTIDHVVPLARGGTNDEANLQVLCAPCNFEKANAPG